jgi:hypothetical protein
LEKLKKNKKEKRKTEKEKLYIPLDRGRPRARVEAARVVKSEGAVFGRFFNALVWPVDPLVPRVIQTEGIAF